MRKLLSTHISDFAAFALIVMTLAVIAAGAMHFGHDGGQQVRLYQSIPTATM